MLLRTLSKYLLLDHSPKYALTIYNPSITIYKTIHSVAEKPIITPTLNEILQMDPDIVLYPSQRLLFILYNPRIITNPELSYRDNIKKITHVLAAIESFEKFSYERPQRYFVYDFLLTDPILSKYII